MVPVFGVDGDLSRGANWYLIVVHVLTDIDGRECAASDGPGFWLNKGWRGCQLTGRDCTNDSPHLGLEYATRHSVEGDLGLIACIDPLQGVLLECTDKLLVPTPSINEEHRSPKLRRDDVHSRSQGNLRREPGICRAYCRLIEVELSIGEFGPQLCDGSINASNV